MRLEHQHFVCYRRHLESRIETKIATIGVYIGQHHPSAGYSFSETGNPLFQGIHLHYDHMMAACRNQSSTTLTQHVEANRALEPHWCFDAEIDTITLLH
jgi:hypothetical protein